MEKKVEIPLERCEFWLDPADDIFIAIPNDQDGHFWCMSNEAMITPNSYPRFVWERLGWAYLDQVVRDRVSDELTELE